MPVFDYSFTVPAPLQAVRDFHRDTSALKRLTPPPTIVQLISIEPLAEGSVSRFVVWVGPLPLRWTAVHRDVTERGFTDVLAAGPAAAWAHTHRFTPLSTNLTRIDEHIEFQHKVSQYILNNPTSINTLPTHLLSKGYALDEIPYIMKIHTLD